MSHSFKHLLPLFLLLLWGGNAGAQSDPLTLDSCRAAARLNYPAIAKLDLIAKSSEFDIRNANRRYLPQLNLSASGAYSAYDVEADTQEIALTNAQYGVQAQVSQQIYDGGETHYRKKISEAQAKLQTQQLESELYSINQRINQIYFGILLFDAQLKQLQLAQETLTSKAKQVEAAVANGVALPSQLDELKVELLNLKMKQTEAASNRRGYLAVLSLFMGEELAAGTELEKPTPWQGKAEINRPELLAFQYQQDLLSIQEKQLRTSFHPKLGAYANGGLSHINADLSGMGNDLNVEGQMGSWSVGASLNWSLSGLYTLGNSRKKIHVQREMAQTDLASFLFNTRLDLAQQDEQLVKFQQLLKQDDELIALRTSILKAADSQLANGVISTHEYIQKLNAEQDAQEQRSLHEIQLLQAQIQRKFLVAGH